MFFQESTFMKIEPYSRSDQTTPNQIRWYTTKASSSVKSRQSAKPQLILPLQFNIEREYTIWILTLHREKQDMAHVNILE